MLDDVSVEQQVRDVDLLKHENEQLESVIKDLKKQLTGEAKVAVFSNAL